MKILGVVALGVLSLNAGCHRDSTSIPAAAPKAGRPAQPASPTHGPTAEQLTSGMVEAVIQGKSALPSLLKFEMSERPVVGQPLDVSIALLPRIAAAPATMEASAISGLDLAQASSRLELSKVEPAEVYRQSVRVVPRQEGVALLGIEVTLMHDDVADTKAFSIPLLVSAQ